MRKWKVLLSVAVAIGGVVAAPAMSAQASTVLCNGPFTGTTNSAVIVPFGGACYMNGATVRGSVTVFPNAVLETCNTFIGGNLQSSQDYVNLKFSTVQGNVVLNRPGLEGVYGTNLCSTGGISPNVIVSSASSVCEVTIGGNLTVSNAPDDGEEATVCYSHVVGNVQVLNNQEDVVVMTTRIDGSLTCVHNFYAYDVSNSVHGWDVGCITESL
jgi:hypothetical protein